MRETSRRVNVPGTGDALFGGAQNERKQQKMISKLNAPTLTALGFTAIAALLGWFVWSDRAPEVPSPEVSPVETAAAPALQTDTITLKKRDTLVAALLRHDVLPSAAHEIAGALRAAGANLRLVRPGDELELGLAADGRPVKLAYSPNAWVRFEVNGSGGKWEAARTEVEPEVRIELRQGEVRGSLWDAVESGAVAPSVLLDLVQIFESEFDFTADTRPGDRFRLLVETRYADGVPVDFGRIVAAQYLSDGQKLTGIGFAAPGHASDRFSYYDPEGRSLKRMFLRSPLQFTRISSGFTYRRPHPVLGGVRPHLAIDYAAPTGTPVWAVANGVVLFAGRNLGNGIQVRLRHRAGYETYYNHLSRIGRGIRRGAQVEQKQVIGHVGSTGLSTGPHLDYRVKRDGRFVNPLSEKFLPGRPIAKSQRALFLEHARTILVQLEQETSS
ncbi:MAG: M23 family metallopeptidase [Sulfuritalea sp.]|nr:M23 family metallopeptidase [Sulfuritalea sp.]